jgi:hypothetical protein
MWSDDPMHINDVLKYGHLGFMQTIEGLAEADCLQEGVCGWWSVQHVVAHIASYERFAEDVLTSLIDPAVATPTLEKVMAWGNAFNDKAVEERDSLTWAETLAEYTTTNAHVTALLAQIPAAKLQETGAIPWYGAEYDVEDFLIYTQYGHKREHGGQIGLFRGRLAAS